MAYPQWNDCAPACPEPDGYQCTTAVTIAVRTTTAVVAAATRRVRGFPGCACVAATGCGCGWGSIAGAGSEAGSTATGGRSMAARGGAAETGSARLELTPGVVQLRPADAMVEAMLRGWRASASANTSGRSMSSRG